MQIWIKEGGFEWWDCKEQWNGKNKAQTLRALLKKAAQGTAQSLSLLPLPPAALHVFPNNTCLFKITLIWLVLELLLSLDFSHSYKLPGILCIEQAYTDVSNTRLSKTNQPSNAPQEIS